MVLADPRFRMEVELREAAETAIVAAAVSESLKGMPASLTSAEPSLLSVNTHSGMLSSMTAAKSALAQTLGPAASLSILGAGLRLIASGI